MKFNFDMSNSFAQTPAESGFAFMLFFQILGKLAKRELMQYLYEEIYM